MTAGDFYQAWLVCELEISSIPSTFAKKLASAMKERVKKMFETDIFRACIFLDPRFNLMMSESDKNLAKDHLVTTWKKICSLINKPEVKYSFTTLLKIQLMTAK